TFATLSAAPRETLAAHTTLGLGGPAADWRRASTLQAVIDAVRDAGTRPLLVLGGGSNVVCADAGFPGVVLAVATEGLHLSKAAPEASSPLRYHSPNVAHGEVSPAVLDEALPEQQFWLHVAAGETWDAVVEACCRWN